MIATGPPGGHFADATVKLLQDGTYDIAVGTAEFGNGTTAVHKGKAVMKAADALAVQLLEFAAEHLGAASGECRLTADAVERAGRVVSLKELFRGQGDEPDAVPGPGRGRGGAGARGDPL